MWYIAAVMARAVRDDEEEEEYEERKEESIFLVAG